MPVMMIITIVLLVAKAGTLAADQAMWPPLDDKAIRVQTEGSRLEGRVAEVTDSTLRLWLATGESSGRMMQEVRMSAIDSLWVRGNSAATGAMVGGIAGAAGWLILVGALCGSMGCEDADWGAIGGITAVSVGTGALLGAGVGAAIRRWRPVFPRKRARLVLQPGGRIGPRSSASISVGASLRL